MVTNSETRNKRVNIPLSSEERAILEAQAKAENRTMTDYARILLLRALGITG